MTLRQTRKPFPLWTLMCSLWYLDPLQGHFCPVLPKATGAMGCEPVSFFPSSSLRRPGLAFLPAAIMVRCLTRPCSSLSKSQNQQTIRTSGFFRPDPKISIYPDVDILMSNGRSSEDTLLVAGKNSEFHSEF